MLLLLEDVIGNKRGVSAVCRGEFKVFFFFCHLIYMMICIFFFYQTYASLAAYIEKV